MLLILKNWEKSERSGRIRIGAGIGAQGGMSNQFSIGLDQKAQDLIISSSREILYAHEKSTAIAG